MSRVKAHWAILLFTVWQTEALAKDLAPIEVAVGLSLPPYVIADEKRSMEYDIEREALAGAGYKLVPVFMDFGDILGSMADGEVDAAMTVLGNLHVGLILSGTHIIYHNHAMTLESSGLAIDEISDLAGRSIMGFQNARSFLPNPFREVTEGSPAYQEVPEQYRQNLALYQGDVEVVVGDINIFNWYIDDPRVPIIPTPARPWPITRSSRQRPITSPSRTPAFAMPLMPRMPPCGNPAAIRQSSTAMVGSRSGSR